MTKERFVAGLPHAFLVFEPRVVVVDDGLNYHTTNVRPADHEVASADDLKPPEIVELIKSSRNPFADRISIGRAPNCDVVLNDASVSKLHAHVRDIDGVLHLVDLGSQNGTFRNEQRLEPNVMTRLSVGDKLQFGMRRAQLADAAAVYDLIRATSDRAIV